MEEKNDNSMSVSENRKNQKFSRVLLLTGNIRWYKMDSEVIIKTKAWSMIKVKIICKE